MLPILVKDDGMAIAESLDIITYIDELAEFGKPIVGPSLQSQELNRWLQQARGYHYALAMPRWPQMGLEEFQTDSAIAYFTRKKSLSIGPFSEALEASAELVVLAEAALSELEVILKNTGSLGSPGDTITIDDFHLFATLRVLTVVRQLKFPSGIDEYTKSLAERSGVPLHWEKAL